MHNQIRSTRPAFTLMEVMLVLVIIVIAAALTVPLAQTMIVDARINAAGDLVRARLADARSRSMEDGRPWRLGFLANTGVFQLAPEESQEWDATNQEPTEQSDLIRDELPRDIIFAREASEILNSKEGGASAGTWETIGVYLPNGSAQEDRTTYFGKAGLMPMRVRLRSLTGGVTVEAPALVKADLP